MKWNLPDLISKKALLGMLKLLSGLSNIKIVYPDGTKGRALYSENDVTLIPALQDGAAVTPDSFLAPFAMFSTAANKFQVNTGSVFISKTFAELQTITLASLPNCSGTLTDITVPDFTPAYYVWLSIEDAGPGFVATVNFGLFADIPNTNTIWQSFPSPEHIGAHGISSNAIGYILIGVVDSSTTPGTLILNQRLHDDGHLIVCDRSPAILADAWSSFVFYRINQSIVFHGGQWWRRNNDVNGDSGGEPGVGLNDWASWTF